MRCPICGHRLRVMKTIQLSNSLLMRYRQCSQEFCPFTDKTYEALNVPEDQQLMDQFFEFIRDTAKNIGKETVGDRLAKLAKELSGRN